ncbi:MAG: LysR family transcriptional regulator [Zoogloeaceae bacterium]|nr:LysR family transcriptional regulator [Zoogloeaceae bacterium]
MGNIGSMATFAIVVERGSFTAAAEALGMSKSVVSKQVSQLERALNVTLLNRTTRQLNLTEAGSVFYEHCRRIVAEGREAEAAVLPCRPNPAAPCGSPHRNVWRSPCWRACCRNFSSVGRGSSWRCRSPGV